MQYHIFTYKRESDILTMKDSLGKKNTLVRRLRNKNSEKVSKEFIPDSRKPQMITKTMTSSGDDNDLQNDWDWPESC